MLICATVIGDAVGRDIPGLNSDQLLRHTESRVRSNHTYISVKKNGRSDCMEPGACTRDGISDINTVSGTFADSTCDSTTACTNPRFGCRDGDNHSRRCLHACSKGMDHFDILFQNAPGQDKNLHPATMNRLASTNNPRTVPVQDPGIPVIGGMFSGIIADGGGITGCFG